VPRLLAHVEAGLRSGDGRRIASGLSATTDDDIVRDATRS